MPHFAATFCAQRPVLKNNKRPKRPKRRPKNRRSHKSVFFCKNHTKTPPPPANPSRAAAQTICRTDPAQPRFLRQGRKAPPCPGGRLLPPRAQKSRGAQCVPARDPKILFFFFLCTFRMRSCSRRAGHSAYSAVMPAIDWASSSSALMFSSPSSASTSLTQATISASPFLQATQLPLLSYSMPMSAMTRSSCTAA